MAPSRIALVSSIAFAFLLAGAGAQEKPRARKRLTFDQVSAGRFGGISFQGRAPAVAWAADGVHLLLGRGSERKLVHPATGAEKEPSAEDLRAAGRQPVPFGRRGRRGRGVRLPREAGAGRWPARSPNGEHYSFVRDHDLWIYSSATETSRRLTEGGSAERLNGELDWVYQEEVYGRGQYRAHWWSPDSQRLAYLSLLEKDVPFFAIANPVPRPARGPREATARASRPIQQQPQVTWQRYPKPGQPNPSVRLGVVGVDGGDTKWIDLEGFPKDCLVVRVGWAPDGKLLFMVQDRIQTWLELCDADPATGRRRRLIREESNSWTDRLPMPRFLADGSFLWFSDRTGYRHIYHHARDGKLLRAITEGEWAVGTIVRVDEAGGRLWFTATKDGAVNNHYYRIRFDGRDLTRLSNGDGYHSLQFDRDGTFAIDTWSSLTSPPRTQLVDVNGEVRRDFGQARVANLARYETGTYELVRIPARDGHVLDAVVLKPVGHDPSRHKYPIWLPTYSGPHAPSVRNRWNGSAYDQFLAQRGILVLRVNVRSSNPRGLKKYVESCYKQLGVQELRDLEDAVAWVVANRGGDKDRVGISGWSYGGFMAGYALTHSKAFRLGIAGAGVYDWRLYDTIYTERYMSTPERNEAGYDKTSCILAAEDLHGHLVLLHGTEDDNVHFQNCMQFVYALQQAGKDFELMIFPNAMHGVGGAQGRQRNRMTWRAIQRHLLAQGG